MSSYKIEVDKNTGDPVMLVDVAEKQIAFRSETSDLLCWDHGPVQFSARPNKAMTAANLVAFLKDRKGSDWEIADIHIHDTDQGPIVIMVVNNPY